MRNKTTKRTKEGKKAENGEEKENVVGQIDEDGCSALKTQLTDPQQIGTHIFSVRLCSGLKENGLPKEVSLFGNVA